MKKKKKMTLEQKALIEAYNNTPSIRIGIAKSQMLGYSDLPMFNKTEQKEIKF